MLYFFFKSLNSFSSSLVKPLFFSSTSRYFSLSLSFVSVSEGTSGRVFNPSAENSEDAFLAAFNLSCSTCGLTSAAACFLASSDFFAFSSSIFLSIFSKSFFKSSRLPSNSFL